MLPVAIAMFGSGAKWQTVGFLGWFGPRGLASIVFAVITTQEAHLAGSNTILLATYLTVGLSVAAHGIRAQNLSATTRVGRCLHARMRSQTPGTSS